MPGLRGDAWINAIADVPGRLLRFLRGFIGEYIAEYPASCLRGIASKEMILEEGLPSNDVFMFQENQRKGNGDFSQSINWKDDEKAIPFMLAKQNVDGSPQFRGGVAVIERAFIDRLSQAPKVGGALSYERDPIEGNAYHGNLLLRQGVSKNVRRFIAATLALNVTGVVPGPLV